MPKAKKPRVTKTKQTRSGDQTAIFHPSRGPAFEEIGFDSSDIPQEFQEDPQEDPDIQEEAPLTLQPGELVPLDQHKTKSKISRDGPRIRYFPKPSKFNFNSDKKGDVDSFFRYWKAIHHDKEFSQRYIVYAYRNWPITDHGLINKKETNIDKLVDFVDGTSGVLHRYGSGDYHFKLNDAQLGKTVCTLTLKHLRDFENYMPVLDLRTVVLTDPANNSYLELMRSKGTKFPGDKTTESEDDVANVKAFETIDKLTDKLFDRGERERDEFQPTGDLAGIVEMMADGARSSNRIVEDAMKRAAEVSSKANDPAAFTEKVMEMAERLAKPAAGEGGVNNMAVLDMMMKQSQAQMESQAQMYKMVMTIQEQRIAHMELIQQQQQQQAMGGGTGVGVGGVIQTRVVDKDPIDELLSKTEKMKKLQVALTGDNEGGGRGGDGPAWLPYLPMILQGLSFVANVIGSGMYNAAVAKTGVGLPVAPPQPPMPPSVDEGGDEPPAPAQQQQNPNMPRLNPVHAFLETLRPALIAHLNNADLDGADFAAWFINSREEGRITYERMKEQGKETLLFAMGGYPPIKAIMEQIPGRFGAFMDEFLDHDRLMAEGEGEDEDDGEEPPLVGVPPIVAHQIKAQQGQGKKARKQKPPPPAPTAA